MVFNSDARIGVITELGLWLCCGGVEGRAMLSLECGCRAAASDVANVETAVVSTSDVSDFFAPCVRPCMLLKKELWGGSSKLEC